MEGEGRTTGLCAHFGSGVAAVVFGQCELHSLALAFVPARPVLSCCASQSARRAWFWIFREFVGQLADVVPHLAHTVPLALSLAVVASSDGIQPTSHLSAFQKLQSSPSRARSQSSAMLSSTSQHFPLGTDPLLALSSPIHPRDTIELSRKIESSLFTSSIVNNTSYCVGLSSTGTRLALNASSTFCTAAVPCSTIARRDTNFGLLKTRPFRGLCGLGEAICLTFALSL
ncbi:hypothetical protein BLNAU_16395 [Blattamonas nauphoetae]|uniref:Uncharacterized protein n=1 Tax=Blattamonas nauphoetae TaxID=2049346 RepID=A0ABQ9XCR4_9EUKA|nr:hypothetical protein BLNAU_16395 [Blattamonas nauphoetae]